MGWRAAFARAVGRLERKTGFYVAPFRTRHPMWAIRVGRGDRDLCLAEVNFGRRSVAFEFFREET